MSERIFCKYFRAVIDLPMEIKNIIYINSILKNLPVHEIKFDSKQNMLELLKFTYKSIDNDLNKFPLHIRLTDKLLNLRRNTLI